MNEGPYSSSTTTPVSASERQRRLAVNQSWRELVRRFESCLTDRKRGGANDPAPP